MSLDPIYIIPGAGDNADDYTALHAAITHDGFFPISVPVDWSIGKFSEWHNQARTFIDTHRSKKSSYGIESIIGFSYGGVIASLMDNYIGTPRFICSAPNVYDLSKRRLLDKITRPQGVQIDWNDLDEKCYTQSSDYGFSVFTYGTNESPFYRESAAFLADRIKKLRPHFDGIEIISVQNASHNINGA